MSLNLSCLTFFLEPYTLPLRWRLGQFSYFLSFFHLNWWSWGGWFFRCSFKSWFRWICRGFHSPYRGCCCMAWLKDYSPFDGATLLVEEPSNNYWTSSTSFWSWWSNCSLPFLCSGYNMDYSSFGCHYASNAIQLLD